MAMENPPHENVGTDFHITKLCCFWDSHMIVTVFNWMKANATTNEAKAQISSYSAELFAEESLIPNLKSLCEGNQALLTAAEAKTNAYKAEIEKLEELVHSFIKALIAYKKDQQNRVSATNEGLSTEDLSNWWQKMKPTTLPDDEIEKQQLIQDFKKFTTGVDDKMLRLAKLLYDCGEYAMSKKYLDIYLRLVAEIVYEGADVYKRQICYWGIAAAVIQNHANGMVEEEKATPEEMKTEERDETDGEDRELFSGMKPEVAACCIMKLADIIESENRMARDVLLLQRAWLVHWALWLILKYYLQSIHNTQVVPTARIWGALIDWLTDEKTMGITHLIAPHLLRYLSAYAIINRKRKDHFNTVLQAILSSRSKYFDAFTCLIEALFANFDFDSAQQHMAEIGETCRNDFFLEPIKTGLEEHCRLLIFETYCRIHRSINIDMISKKVNMAPEVAEKWIVNLIRHAKLEAKIDSEKNRVEMAAAPISLYEQVIDRTMNLGIRSNLLLQNLARPTVIRGDGNESRYNKNKGRAWNKDSQRGGRGRGKYDKSKYNGNNNQKHEENYPVIIE